MRRVCVCVGGSPRFGDVPLDCSTFGGHYFTKYYIKRAVRCTTENYSVGRKTAIFICPFSSVINSTSPTQHRTIHSGTLGCGPGSLRLCSVCLPLQQQCCFRSGVARHQRISSSLSLHCMVAGR